MTRSTLFSFILVSLLLGLPVGAMALTAETETFKTKFTDQNGFEFERCLTFNSNGMLDISGGTPPHVWAYKGLGTSKFAWQSVSVCCPPPLAFSGVKSFLGLYGDGINDQGQLFKFVGKRVKECSVAEEAENAGAFGNP